MKKLITLIAATAIVAGSCATGFAQSPSSDKAPGQQMKDKGSLPGSPGASGYAPGQQMQDKGSVPGTKGASGYAPGQATTGAGAPDKSKSDNDKK